MAYVYRRPFDYRAPRGWIGTVAAAPPAAAGYAWGQIIVAAWLFWVASEIARLVARQVL